MAPLNRFKYDMKFQNDERGFLKWLHQHCNFKRPFSGVAESINKRQRVEIALQESEERFRQIAETINQFFFVRAADLGLFLYVSPAYEKMFGRTCESLYQDPKSWLEAVHPDDRELVSNSLAQQLEGAAVLREYRIIRPDGAVRWIAAQISPVFNQGGELLQYIGFAEDITDRKQAELELRQQKDLRETIYNESTDALFLVDPKTMLIMDCNRRAVELFEVESKADLIGIQGHTLRRHPLTSKGIDEVVAEVEQKGFWSREIEYVTHKGNVFWGNLAAKPVQITNQNVHLVRVTDITDRKHAEIALRESEERFRSAFHNAPIGMALIGLNDCWLKVNPRLCEMLGYSETELLAMNASVLVHPQDVDKFNQYMQLVLTHNNHTDPIELRYYCKDGYISWGLVSISVVWDGEAQPLYYVGQIQDITEQYAVRRMKDEFVSIVSHELRTPLTAIQGFLGLLNTGLYDYKAEKAKRMVSLALSNSDRLVRLVNDILDLERLASGKVQLAMESCDAEELMQRAVEGVQSLAEQAKIVLTIVPTAAAVLACSDSIIQTLTNLLSNAIKFSSANTTVTLSAEAQAGSILFQVKDQGRGIPSDKLESIFEQFQQVDVSDSRQKGGTGLGLAICQRIIQQHGGAMWVESRVGEGSTFYFTLPRVEGHHE